MGNPPIVVLLFLKNGFDNWKHLALLAFKNQLSSISEEYSIKDVCNIKTILYFGSNVNKM